MAGSFYFCEKSCYSLRFGVNYVKREKGKDMPKEHVVCQVLPGSIAEEMEIEPGDVLLSINDTDMEDIFDYHYLCSEEYIVVLIRKKDGEEWELEIEKEYNEDLGIVFENGLMDEYKSCMPVPALHTPAVSPAPLIPFGKKQNTY